MGTVCHTHILLLPREALSNQCCVPALAGRTVSEDGFEAHLGTNHLGPFLLSLLLLPSMLQTARQARPSCEWPIPCCRGDSRARLLPRWRQYGAPASIKCCAVQLHSGLLHATIAVWLIQ